ncbi:MAG: hypothetical protein OEW67_05895 [Cyclobacteriaceae bacterium]|nr:hypothetical protein [Cyclobacteriaceae bacterium]
MKSFIVTISIIASLSIILSSCETDEPPSIKQDISGVWVLEELYSFTYQNETEIIHEENIPVYGEEIEFLPEGLYIVGSDADPSFNEQLAFAFAGELVNETLDTASWKIFGTWESHINVEGDQILHFDRYYSGLDSYMFVDDIDENNLTLTMVVNHEYSDINIENFVYPAEYQATWDATYYNDIYVDDGFAYDDGYDIGETIGFYDGYFDTYWDSYDYIFVLFYGFYYTDTFFNIYDPNLADVVFNSGFWVGYDDGYIRGENEAIQHDNGKDKSVTLTYKFTRK